MPRTVEEVVGPGLSRLRGAVQAANVALASLEEAFRASSAVDLEDEKAGAAALLREFLPQLDELKRRAPSDLAHAAACLWNTAQSEQLAVQQRAARRQDAGRRRQTHVPASIADPLARELDRQGQRQRGAGGAAGATSAEPLAVRQDRLRTEQEEKDRRRARAAAGR